MADDPSTIVWRLGRVEDALRDLGQRVVPTDLYGRDLAVLQRDIADIKREIAEEKLARKEAVEAERAARKEADKGEGEAREKADKALAERMDKGGANWRQALFSGVVPGVFFVITLAVTILLAMRGGK